jgi:hypothetical protein
MAMADDVYFGKKTFALPGAVLAALEQREKYPGLTDEQIEDLVCPDGTKCELFRVYQAITPTTDADGDADADVDDVKILLSDEETNNLVYVLQFAIGDSVCTTFADCVTSANQLAGLAGLAQPTGASIGGGGRCRIGMLNEKLWAVTRCI